MILREPKAVMWQSFHAPPNPTSGRQTVNFRDSIISVAPASCPEVSSPSSLTNELRETHSLESAISINSLPSLDHQVTTISSKSKLVILMVG